MCVYIYIYTHTHTNRCRQTNRQTDRQRDTQRERDRKKKDEEGDVWVLISSLLNILKSGRHRKRISIFISKHFL